MKTQPTHAPTPWKFHIGRGANPRFHIQTTAGYQIASTPEISRNNEEAEGQLANASLIVHAVNAHEEMVKALKDVLFVLKGQSQIGNYLDSSERDISLEGVVEQAIAKAEARS